MTAIRNNYITRFFYSVFTINLVLSIGGCGREDAADNTTETATKVFAESAYLNGRIYTVDRDNSWARAIAVAEGKIIAVGSNAEIAKHVDNTTKVYNLYNLMLMPGIHDMHAHPMQGGEKHKFQCSFPFTVTVDEIVAILTECAANTQKGEWIRGGQWAIELMASDTVPHKKILDAITTEHPIYLGDSTVHGAWLNSKALEVLEITRETADPAGGVIVREPNSMEPTGILIDNAAYDVLKEIPRYSVEQYETALEWAMLEMNKVGVTAVKDALADRHALIAYKNLDRAGRLTMKISTSITALEGWPGRIPERQNLRVLNYVQIMRLKM